MVTVWKALGKKCVHLARFSSTFLTLSLSLCPSLVNVCFVFLFHYILNDSVDWQFQLTIGTVGYGNNMLRSHFAVRISCFCFSLARSLFIPTQWHEMPHSIFMFCWCHYWNGIISGHQCLSWLDHIALTFLHDGYWPLNFHALRILKSKPFFLFFAQEFQEYLSRVVIDGGAFLFYSLAFFRNCCDSYRELECSWCFFRMILYRRLTIIDETFALLQQQQKLT